MSRPSSAQAIGIVGPVALGSEYHFIRTIAATNPPFSGSGCTTPRPLGPTDSSLTCKTQKLSQDMRAAKVGPHCMPWVPTGPLKARNPRQGGRSDAGAPGCHAHLQRSDRTLRPWPYSAGAMRTARLWPLASTGSCRTSILGSSGRVQQANSRQTPSGSKK